MSGKTPWSFFLHKNPLFIRIQYKKDLIQPPVRNICERLGYYCVFKQAALVQYAVTNNERNNLTFEFNAEFARRHKWFRFYQSCVAKFKKCLLAQQQLLNTHIFQRESGDIAVASSMVGWVETGTLSNLLCGTLCIQSNNSDVMMKTSRVSWKCLIYVPWKYLKVLEFDSGDVTCYITHFFWSLPLKCQTVCTITISQMNVLCFFSGCSLWQSVSSCSAEFVVGWVHTCPAEALSRRGEVDLLASTGRRAFVVCSGSFGALWNVATLSREM